MKIIGRERELEEVRTLLGRHRLLTVTGAGGIGKTRLAQELTAQNPTTVPTRWVDLTAANADSTDDVLTAWLRAIDPIDHVGIPVEEQILLALERLGPAFLVVDNCEQVLDANAANRTSTPPLTRPGHPRH